MDLSTWLEKHQMEKKKFAKKAGISTMTLYNIMQGKMPLPKNIDKIEKATYGAVKYKDLRKIQQKAHKKADDGTGRYDAEGNLRVDPARIDNLLDRLKHNKTPC